jgi:phenylalanyl-tRNA synthetase beta chain
MRILYSWLAELVTGLPAPAELGRMLTERGVEAEVLIPLAPAVAGLQFGRVLRKVGTDKAGLPLYDVELEGKEREMSCRAPEIPAGFTVGCDRSQKTIPTLEELELAPVRFPLVLPAMMKREQLEADMVLDFSPVSNRGDLLSHLGIGREASYLEGCELRMPALAEVDEGKKGGERPVIELPAPDLCPRYVGSYFTGVKIAPCPDWMAYRLSLCGVSVISNIVDLSNYLLLELGQPMHTFDRRMLMGAISARRAAAGEKFTAINHVEYDLTTEHLVIADAEKAVAIAGVMGGVESEIGERTKSVLLESAFFTPRNIRVTSKRLGLQSESSLRFGRGIDPMLPGRATRRFIHLAREIGAADYVEGSFADANVYKDTHKPIAFVPERINALLGTAFDRDNIVNSLRAIGMKVSESNGAWETHPPSWRHDLEIWEDLAEEVLRLNHFDSVEAKPVVVPLRSGGLEADLEFEQQVEDALIALGGQEIMCQPFLSVRRAEQSFGEGHSLVALENPDTHDQAFLAGSLLPGMAAVVEHNFRHGGAPPFMFEPGHVYSAKPQPGGTYHELKGEGKSYYEQRAVGLVFADGFVRPAHSEPDFAEGSPYFVLKGVVEAVLQALGVETPEYEAMRDVALAEDRSFTIRVGGAPVGVIGEVRPDLAETGEATVAFAQLSLDALQPLSSRAMELHGYSPYPPIARDLAVLVPLLVQADEVLHLIRDAAGELLADAYAFDVYRGKQIPPDHRSIAYRLVFQSAERTLTNTEVDERLFAVLEALYRKKGIVVRDFSRIAEMKLFSEEHFSDELRKVYGV